jgi:transposase-like protein
MRKDKQKAIKMRAAGDSYAAIARKLDISKGTLAAWFAREEWSRKIGARNAAIATDASRVRMLGLNRVRGVNLKRAYAAAREAARGEFGALKHHPMFIAGVMLYWGEGDKVSKHQVRLINADPRMVRLYTAFLRKICRIPENKIRAAVTIYPDLDRGICERYWSGRTGIPRGNFTKTMVILGRHKNRRLAFGTCTVIVSSAYFKVKIIEWIRLFSEELMNTA